MIEINLLPEEYRPQTSTPLPLFLTVVVGVCVVGAIFIYYINLTSELAQLRDREGRLQAEKTELDAAVLRVQELEREIATQKSRQDTVISISESKIMWSLKLVQFANVMAEYPSFWITSLGLTRTGGTRGAGALSMAVTTNGTNMRDVARWRESLQRDVNFYYHFDELPPFPISVVVTPGSAPGSPPSGLAFQAQLPLKGGATRPAGGGQ